MKQWLTVPIAGTGTGSDPFRPDLRGELGIRGYAAAAYSVQAGEVLVLVLRDRAALNALPAAAVRPGVRRHADVPLSPAQHTAVVTEAKRLGAGPDWQPDGYKLDGGG